MRPDGGVPARLVPMTRDVEVWVCPFCGSCERYDELSHVAYTPYCEWCADDPEGGGEVLLVRHVAVPLAAWDAAPADPVEAAAEAANDYYGHPGNAYDPEFFRAVLVALGWPRQETP